MTGRDGLDARDKCRDLRARRSGEFHGRSECRGKGSTIERQPVGALRPRAMNVADVLDLTVSEAASLFATRRDGSPGRREPTPYRIGTPVTRRQLSMTSSTENPFSVPRLYAFAPVKAPSSIRSTEPR